MAPPPLQPYRNASERLPTHLDGIAEILDRYDHFILDIFGILHDGIRPFPDTVQTLQMLQKANKQICLLSNSPRRASGAARQMEQMGIPPALYDHILTSGEATHLGLTGHIQAWGKRCWFIGTPVMEEVLKGIDITLVNTPDNADFILNSVPGTSDDQTRQLKKHLEKAAARTLPMICANPDLVVHIGSTLHECAGTFAQYYEDILGGTVIYYGKPHHPVYDHCHQVLGRPDKGAICAVGDSLLTDIAGAHHFGVDSILNLSGIHIEEWGALTPSAANIEKFFKDRPHTPRYIMQGFK